MFPPNPQAGGQPPRPPMPPQGGAGGGMPPGQPGAPPQAGGGMPGQGGNPQQMQAMQEQMKQIAAQVLGPDELQIVAASLSPEFMQIMEKLYGPEATFFLQPLADLTAGMNDMDLGGQMMETGDQMGGIDGDMPMNAEQRDDELRQQPSPFSSIMG